MNAPHNPPPRKPAPKSVLREVYLPVGAALALVGTAGLLLIPLSQTDLSFVANIVFVCLCQLPLLLVLLLVYLALMGGNFYLYKTNRATSRQLKRAQGATTQLKQRAERTTDSLNRRSIGWASRFAMLDPLFDLFDRPTKKGDTDHE